MISFLTVLVRFVRAVRLAWTDPEFRALAFLTLVMLLTGTVFYRQMEGWSLIDSLYFSVTTLTTVGFGDLTPSSAVGKVFTILYVFVGLGIILAFVNAVAERAMQRGAGGRNRGPENEGERNVGDD